MPQVSRSSASCLHTPNPENNRASPSTMTFCIRSLLPVVLLLNLIGAYAQEDLTTTSYDGRLLVLDSYHMDGSHHEEYVLMTASEQLMSLQSSDKLENFRTNDVVRVWLQPAELPDDTDTGTTDSRLVLETSKTDAAPAAYAVVDLVKLKQDWMIPADAAQVWGDGKMWEDDTDADAASEAESGTAELPTVAANNAFAELPVILAAQSLSPVVQSISSGLSPPYARTTKVVSDMSMLVYIIDMCGKGGGPATTAEKWNKTMLHDGALGNYVSSCSAGIGYIAPANSRAVNIKLGCSGTLLSTGDPWTSDSCSGDNLMRIAYAADEYAQFQLGINPRKYRHHALVLPAYPAAWMHKKCDWAGTAVMGFSGPAWTYMWIAGEVWDNPQLYLHEIGHNYMLGHSDLLLGAPTSPNPQDEPETNVEHHGDWSSAMGYCCALRCFNAPHAWQMGWSQALAVLDSTQLQPGTTLPFFVPAQMSARRSFVTVTTNWVNQPPAAPRPAHSATPPSLAQAVVVDASPAFEGDQPSSEYDTAPMADTCPDDIVPRNLQQASGTFNATASPPPTATVIDASIHDNSGDNAALTSQHTFWISWRPAAEPYDMPMPGFANGLLIHLYDGVSQSDVRESFFQTRLQPGKAESWTDSYYRSGLVVRLIKAYTAGANITICRIGAAAENTTELCTDGLDNDCDGVLDDQDPACAGLVPPAPPSPPLPTRTNNTSTAAAVPPQFVWTDTPSIPDPPSPPPSPPKPPSPPSPPPSPPPRPPTPPPRKLTKATKPPRPPPKWQSKPPRPPPRRRGTA